MSIVESRNRMTKPNAKQLVLKFSDVCLNKDAFDNPVQQSVTE